MSLGDRAIRLNNQDYGLVQSWFVTCENCESVTEHFCYKNQDRDYHHVCLCSQCWGDAYNKGRDPRAVEELR